MKRFIFVSFAFLAWAFFELSGGTDFQPPVQPSVQPSAAMTPPAPKPAIALATATTKERPVKAATLVASPAIESPEPTRPEPQPAAHAPVAAPDIETVARLDQIRTSLNQGLSLFPDSDSNAQPLTLASLEQGAAGLGTAPVPEETPPTKPVEVAPPPADIREITGTRVNMRDGPGTIYPVVTKLTIGHEVEVLGDSGTGWLRLRSLPEQQIGWISASLVSKSKR